MATIIYEIKFSIYTFSCFWIVTFFCVNSSYNLGTSLCIVLLGMGSYDLLPSKSAVLDFCAPRLLGLREKHLLMKKMKSGWVEL